MADTPYTPPQHYTNPVHSREFPLHRSRRTGLLMLTLSILCWLYALLIPWISVMGALAVINIVLGTALTLVGLRNLLSRRPIADVTGPSIIIHHKGWDVPLDSLSLSDGVLRGAVLGKEQKLLSVYQVHRKDWYLLDNLLEAS